MSLDFTAVNPGQIKDPRSDLMKAKARAGMGVKVNACPFGCQDRDLDEHGYCRHLVGTTEDMRFYEPLVMVRGRRVTQVPRERTQGDGGEYTEGPPILPMCKDGDVFRQITTSFRVYRDVDKEKRELEEAQAKAEAPSTKPKKQPAA